jgi:type II secretory pathway pseudopilin PulG
MNKERRISSGDAGYTILEMVFVVVCVGIILAVTVPAFGGFIASSRLNGAQNELVGDLQYARSLAVRDRKTLHIEFTTDAYEIIETATDELIRRRELPRGVTCTASADPSFYPWGLSDATAITINSNGRARNVQLSSNGHVGHY